MSAPFYGSEVQDEVSTVENPNFPEHIEMYNGPNEYGYDAFQRTEEYEPEVQGPNTEVIRTKIRDDVERTHERANVDRPCVRVVRPDQWSPQQLNIGGPYPQNIIQNDPRRHRVFIQNLDDSNSVFVGGTSNMQAGGYGSIELPPGREIWLEHTNDIWGVSNIFTPGVTTTLPSYEGDVSFTGTDEVGTPSDGGSLIVPDGTTLLTAHLELTSASFDAVPFDTPPTMNFYVQTSPDGVAWTTVATVNWDMNTQPLVLFNGVSVPVGTQVRFAWEMVPGTSGGDPVFFGGVMTLDNAFFTATVGGTYGSVLINVLTEWFSS